jgi:uncharacterized repeat protein (TIGR01451 family)
MKIAAVTLLLAIAASPASVAHVESGGPAHPNQLPVQARPLLDFDGYEMGSALLSLRVEGGTFHVPRDGRLHAFRHKYLYRLTHADLIAAQAVILSQLNLGACGTPYLALPPTLVSGPPGEPEGWEPSRWQGPDDRILSWECDEVEEAMQAGTTYQFVVYSDGEPESSTIYASGWSFWDPFSVQSVTASFFYVAPGCARAPRPVTPEFELTLSAAPERVSPGHVVRFRLQARNVGLGAAANVILRQALPAELRYLPGSLKRNGVAITDNGSYPLASGLNLGAIAPGRTEEITFEARVRPAATAGQRLLHVATLSSDETPLFESLPARTEVGEPDRTPPVLTITAPTASTYLQEGTLTLRFNAADADPGIDPEEIVATLDGQPTGDGTTLDLTALSPGAHTFMLSATDRAGNRTLRPVRFTVAATLGTLFKQVMRLRAAGRIGNDWTMSTLTGIVMQAIFRMRAGDVAGTVTLIQSFKSAVNHPARRTAPPGGRPAIQDDAAAALNASADYVLEHPAL